MTTLEFLQSYWWLIIAVLGGLLVFLLFVQGGQTMLYGRASEAERQLMVNALGRKWELTFTTLVVFGGAFFASFPLFYSTSFGGAYWLWMTILVSFVLQAVSYEFRRKNGNLYGTRTYDAFLMLNGVVGCVMLGVAVATMFFGGEFVIARDNILDARSPVISQWAPTHGLEAMTSWKCLLLGVTVLFLSRTQGALYFINSIRTDAVFEARLKRKVCVNGVVFTLLFVAFVVVLLMQTGLRSAGSGFVAVEYIYLHNLLDMWWLAIIFVAGVVSVLYGIFGSVLHSAWRGGIWFTGVGSIAVVIVLFLIAGYNGTAYYPSILDPGSSLTLANSSSSEFTLTVMGWVSLLVPFVLLYISYVWRKMNAVPLTDKELQKEHHQY